MSISSVEFKIFLENVTKMIEKEKDYLCDLDRKIGDGDHGVTMSIGWQAIQESLNTTLKNETDCSVIALTVGRVFLSAVGSSVGPLYATGFMRGAKELKNKENLTDEDWKDFWVAFSKGVQERGKAEVGDKTMVDTLAPFAEALDLHYSETKSLKHAYSLAIDEGKKGMESTKEILSNLGRSSRLGDRVLGFQDPGATSAYYILREFSTIL